MNVRTSRGPRGGSWTVHRGRWLVGAALLAGAAALAAAPGATADDCPITGIVPCTAPPGSPSPPTTEPPTTTTTEPARPPVSEAEARGHLLALVNAERTQRGLGALTERPEVVDIASRWSAAMADAGELSHNDRYFDDDTRQRLDARLLGENVARAGDIDGAHRALMASEHHRANILDARFTAIGIGAVLRDGTWWLTEDFLQARIVAPAGTRPQATERPRQMPQTTTTAPVVMAADAGDTVVLAAPPREDEEAIDEIDGARGASGVMALAGEAALDRRLAASVAAVALAIAASLAALNRAAGRRDDADRYGVS